MKENSTIKPTNDLAFKKVFGSVGNEDILGGLINDFFGFTPKTIVITNPYNIELYYKKIVEDGNDFSVLIETLNDVGAEITNGSFLAEMQVKKQEMFGERSVFYAFQGYCNNYNRNGRYYDDLRPVYELNVLYESYFKDVEDEWAARKYRLFDDYAGIPMDKEYITIAYLELKKKGFRNPNQGLWQKYFLGEELPKDAPEYIKRAADTIKTVNLKKEEIEMLSSHERYVANQYSDLQTARKEAKREDARNMKEAGMETALIVKITGLSEEEVLKA